MGEAGAQVAEDWDAVVVGSGIGGLTAAACLAGAGKRVLVVERHDVAGGNATVFRRHHQGQQYEFDVGVHYIGECQPGGLFPTILGALGVGERVTFSQLDPDGFDTILLPGITVRIPAGWDEYVARVIEAVPTDRAAIERCLTVLRDVARQSRERYLPGAETPVYDHWAMRPLSELFEECELSASAIAIIDHWNGLYAGAPSRSTVAMHAAIADHYMNGAYYPEGGGQVLAARLVQAIEAMGGEVRTLSPVERVEVTDRRVTGVALASGTQLRTPLVISNADHVRTVRYLVGEEHWDPATLRFVEEAEMTLGLVVVYVVVDLDLMADRPNTNYHVFGGLDHEATYAALDAGRLPDGDWAYLAFASKKDPDNPHLCPPGHTNFQIMTLAPRGFEYWGVTEGPADGGKYRRDAEYRARKEELTERLITTAESVLGPFRDHIVHVEMATPLSHQRYTSATGGTSYGYLHSPEQSGPNRPPHRTEIEGLWVTGANTSSGHGIAGAMVGGVTCAGQVLERPLLIEMMMGARLIDPTAIPADAEDFDPLFVSRGAALRAKRAGVGTP
jgi:phytoene dehydrogenase-like protein